MYCDEVRFLLKFAVTRTTVRTVLMMWSASTMINLKKCLADPVLQYFSVDDSS